MSSGKRPAFLSLPKSVHLPGSGILMAMLLATPPTVKAQTTFQDGTFNPADWSVSQVYTSGNGGSGSGAQMAGGGNPGSCWVTTHNMATNPARIALFHARAGATFNPATQGVINSINFSMDIRTISDPNGYGGQHAGLAVRQNSIVYVAPFVGNGSMSWLTRSQSALTAGNFTEYDGPGHPDFTLGGAPMQFGFLTGNHNPPGGAPASQTHVAYDNWSMSLTYDLSGVTEAAPPATQLNANVPNPFRTATRIDFEVARPGPASILVYDVSGRLLRTFRLRMESGGSASVTWDGRTDSGMSVPGGVYFCRLRTEDGVLTRRMTLLRD